MKKAFRYKRILLFFTTLVVLFLHTGMFWYIWDIYYNNQMLAPFTMRGNWLMIAVYVVLLYTFSIIYGAYKVGYLRTTEVVYSQVLSLLAVNFITYCQISLLSLRLVNPLLMIALLLAQLVVSILWAILANRLYLRLYPPRKMIIVYGSHNATELVLKMSRRSDKYRICASVNIEEGLDEVYDRIASYESVIICDVKAQLRNKLIKYCFEHSIRTYITPKISDIIIQGSDSVNLFDSPLFLCRNQGLNFEQRFFKRALDLLVAGILVILTSPLMGVLALAIKLYDHGPVLFRQRCCTLHGKEFQMYKFRGFSLTPGKAGSSAGQPASRITPVGKLICTTRLDNLPQLFNILSGDMSMVGPRPERAERTAKYIKEIPEYAFRLKVKGGLTGYAQIFGRYSTTPYDRLKLDLMYIENYSFLMDLKVMLMTLKTLFMAEEEEFAPPVEITKPPRNMPFEE